jgi:hypothetical protein
MDYAKYDAPSLIELSCPYCGGACTDSWGGRGGSYLIDVQTPRLPGMWKVVCESCERVSMVPRRFCTYIRHPPEQSFIPPRR